MKPQSADPSPPPVWHTVPIEQSPPEIQAEPQKVDNAASKIELKTNAKGTSSNTFPILFFLLVSIIPIAMLALGAIVKDQCWMDSSIPDMLISLSVILFVHVLFSVFAYLIVKEKILKGFAATTSSIKTGIRIVGATAAIFDLVSLALLITLSVKVFGRQMMVQSCSQPLQDGIYGVLIASWIAAALHTILVGISCYRRSTTKQIEPTKTMDFTTPSVSLVTRR